MGVVEDDRVGDGESRSRVGCSSLSEQLNEGKVTMQRGKQIRFVALVGILILAAAACGPAFGVPPGGTPPPGWTDAALNGEVPPGRTTVSGSGASAVWTISGGGDDIELENF